MSHNEGYHLDQAIIKVIGVGGGGCNAVEYMISQSLPGVEFITVNTDKQALANYTSQHKVQIGTEITKGLGAGADPMVGKASAQESKAHLIELIQGADMVFITAGMGGGTGTGAAPFIAELAKRMGILTVGVVTKPFSFEGSRRTKMAQYGITELSKHVDSLITIPNNRLLETLDRNLSLLDAFIAANNVLNNAVKGISNLITQPGLINVDFADVRAVMANRGIAMMGNASANGANRAEEAAKAAISSPLLENIDLSKAKGVLVNITAGVDMSIGEFETVGAVVSDYMSDDATVIVGTVVDMDMTDNFSVTVVVTSEKASNNENVTASQPKESSKVKSKAAKCLMTESVKFEVDGNSNLHASDKYNDLNEVEYLDIPAFLRRKV
ncbi:cell division protein FtsZ [Francisellaceae bacterium]|nr:cell division protein FtsZ [Francisellaceae bacterium]